MAAPRRPPRRVVSIRARRRAAESRTWARGSCDVNGTGLFWRATGAGSGEAGSRTVFQLEICRGATSRVDEYRRGRRINSG